jgi:nitrate/TMAO reductase-like tetraheme cytochrome c subunit
MKQVSVLALAMLSLVPLVARAEPTCVTCHLVRAEARLRAPAMREPTDVHGAGGIECVDCHGGDPDEPTARAHEAGRGFRGVPDALGVPQMCGRCHDGSHRLVPAALAAFRQGAHGRALAAGRDAPTCTDCHDAHGTTSHDEAGTRTHHDEVSALCGDCHADPERMRASGLSTEVLEDWRGSVHHDALTEGGASCVDCHDAHRAATGLSAVRCGDCHEAQRHAFDRGPHAHEYERLGFLDCVECHENHAIRMPDASMLEGRDAVCRRCHGAGQEALERVARLAAHAHEIDSVRASLDREDPRRTAVIDALHALDADGLDQALAAIPAAELHAAAASTSSPASTSTSTSTSTTPAASLSPSLLTLAVALALALVVVVVVVVRRRR